MKRFSRKLRFNRRKDGPSNSDAVISTDIQDGAELHDGSNTDHNQLNREELNTSVQAASQALQNTRGITGKKLEKDDKPGYYGQLTASVVVKLSAFTDFVQKIADAHPYSKIAWMIISSAVTVITYAQDVDQNILDLFVTLDSTYKFIEDTKEIENHPSYERILTNLAKQTVECAYFIRDYAKIANFWIRTGKNLLVKPIKKRVKVYQDAFKRILTEFQNHSALHTEIAVGRLLEWTESTNEALSVGNLPYAPGAGLHTGKQCLPGTRIEVLEDIINWVNDIDDSCPRLFWLAGPAGTGKSAIAHSIALWFQSIGRLGSFFCFDRNSSIERRERVFSTIARDLADLDMQIKRELSKVLHNKTSVQNTADLHLQWKHFLFDPLQAISEVSTGPILIIIDALDESGDPISRQDLLKVLAKEISLLPVNFRFLVTSRPEQDITTAFRGSQTPIRTKSMDSIPELETKRDILAYFKMNLADSFGDSRLRRLVDLSQGVFQWAYLAVQFLSGLGNTAGSTITERYEDLINIQRIDSINDNLDTMYTQILSSLFNTKQPRVMTRFRSVIGSILAASEPLSLNNLVALRRGNVSLSQRENDINSVIQYTGALLSGIDDPSSTIRPLHISFREYLLDNDRSHDFFIDLSQCHQDFAFGCLRTMKEGLRFNICDISNSQQPNRGDEDLPKRISSRISVPLSYSCRFWGSHVSSSIFDNPLASQVEGFFHENFLHWLEVMSLLKTVHVAARSMSGLISWNSGSKSKSLHDFAVDGGRFIRSFSDAIAFSSPHVYLSALPFCPESSIIYQTYINHFPNTLRIASEPIRSWPLAQRAINLPGGVKSICFSHKGEYLAVGLAKGELKLFNSESFDTLWSKELSAEESVDGVQFLPDDKSLIFATPTGVYMLDILTGDITLYNSFQFFFQVLFSSNAKFVTTFTPSHLVVWNLETDERVIDLPFEIDRLPSTSGGFSESDDDGDIFVTYSDNVGVQVWDLETGAVLHGPFTPPSHLITNVTDQVRVSPNGKHIVFINDFGLLVWNFQDDSIIFFKKPRIGSLFFSPDGNCIITRSSDGKLTLHYINGKEVHHETDRGIRGVACSKDGRWLAVRSDNQLVIRELDGWQSSDDNIKRPPVESVLLDASSDGKYFISASEGDSLMVWDVKSGQSVREISRDTTIVSRRPILSPMSRYLGYIFGDRVINIHDIDSGSFKKFSFDDETIRIQGLAFAQDEKRLAALSMTEGRIYIWDIDSSKILETLTIPSYENYLVFRASSNFRIFVCLLRNGGIILLDRIQSISLELPTYENLDYEVVEDFAFSSDDEYILMSRGSGVLHINLVTKEKRLIKLQQTRRAVSLDGEYSPTSTTMHRRIYIIPNSETLLVETGALGDYNIWDASSGEYLYPISIGYPHLFVKDFIPIHQYIFATTKSNGHARILALKHNESGRICFSSDDRHSLQLPPGSSAKLQEDGWVVNQDGQLLFWVPKDYHSTLHVPGLIYILEEKSMKLDLSSFSYGESWTACCSNV
ncbi:hypothetical protein Clacol_003158 [Clathrus columnatus]|uniref:NACHT domain-containing protein n=1 Tax=Clathrus columnatus TaxID=1419009 RepID=A0AAV5A8F7_9AGAM|nr:hypothetical protein Clacol_003158 [Clathrus columnatus]